MNNQVIRRKWSFEKGRNSKSVILAAVVTAAVFAVALGGFKYEFTSPAEKRQSTEVSLILSYDRETLSLLGKYDPACIYRVNTGGIPFCRYCRRSHSGDCPAVNGELAVDLQLGNRSVIPEYEYEIRSELPASAGIPAAGKYAPVLPHPQRVPEIKQPQVVTEDGRILEFPKLNELPVHRAKGAAVIRFSGLGLLMQSEIIRSSGDRELDHYAAVILKSSGIEPGIYTVNWPGGEK
ncbi:MAG: hypothetical protein IKC94_03120 [Lentisphaeria bacterium]|nr:hypothetical protein [Lentisphaeria bacterium]